MNRKSVGKPFEIDQRAIKIFLAWLQDNWLPREQKPDFFVDFVVEIVENGEPTGRHFAAQVKGFEDKGGNRTQMAHPFKAKHLKYYLEQCPHPLFLFLINVTSREGYWLFAQKRLKETLPKGILDKQKSYSLQFSVDDDLANITKFKCLLPEAEKYVRDLHPGSIRAAIAKRKAELEAKDPRCDVSVSFQDGHEQIQIAAKEQFSFSAKINSKNVAGWRDFFERGKEVKFAPDEVEIVGAPLLKEMLSKSGIASMSFGQEYPVTILLQCGAACLQLDGKIRSGTKFATITGVIQKSILNLEAELSFEDGKIQFLSTHEGLDLTKWNDHPILFLPYFDQIRSYIAAMCECKPLKMEILHEGNVVMSATAGDYDPAAAKSTISALEFLFKCRWLAAHFNVNPNLPDLKTISPEQWDIYPIIYGLVRDQQITVPYRDWVITFVASMVNSFEKTKKGHLRVFHDKGVTIDLFGAHIPVGPMDQIYTGMELVSFKPLDAGRAEYVFETTEKTLRICKLLEPDAAKLPPANC